MNRPYIHPPPSPQLSTLLNLAPPPHSEVICTLIHPIPIHRTAPAALSDPHVLELEDGISWKPIYRTDMIRYTQAPSPPQPFSPTIPPYSIIFPKKRWPFTSSLPRADLRRAEKEKRVRAGGYLL